MQSELSSLAERLVQPTLAATLVATGSAIGKALALSAMAIGVGFFGPTAQMIFGAIRMLGQLAGVAIFTGYVLHCFAIADDSCYDWAGQ